MGERDRQDAQEQARAADLELRNRLLFCTEGNYIDTLQLNDGQMIRIVMKTIALPDIMQSIKTAADRWIFLGNQPVRSCDQPSILKKIADYVRVPKILAAWQAAAQAQQKPADASI